MRYCKERARVGTCTRCGNYESCYIRQDQDEFGDLGYDTPPEVSSGYQITGDELDSEFASPE
jgi:hypothetical protein